MNAKQREELAVRVFECVKSNISKHERDAFQKALRAAVAAVCAVEKYDAKAARQIYERCETMLLE